MESLVSRDIINFMNTKQIYKKARNHNYNNLGRMETNIGIFFTNEDFNKNYLSEKKDEIIYAKVFDDYLNHKNITLLKNLKFLDLTAMELVELDNPFSTILGLPQVKHDNNLTKLSNAQKLECLMIKVGKKNDWLGGKSVKGKYDYLEHLPNSLHTLIMKNISNEAVEYINLNNLPPSVEKILFYKMPINKSNKLLEILVKKLGEFRFPLFCKVYFDNKKIEILTF